MIFAKHNKRLISKEDRPLKKGEYARSEKLGYGICDNCENETWEYDPKECENCTWRWESIEESFLVFDNFVKKDPV